MQIKGHNRVVIFNGLCERKYCKYEQVQRIPQMRAHMLEQTPEVNSRFDD